MGMALLRARDPIQFYAEVPLYESELDDNGSSQLSVKVTMPAFLLLPVAAESLCRFAVMSRDDMCGSTPQRGICTWWHLWIVVSRSG